MYTMQELKPELQIQTTFDLHHLDKEVVQFFGMTSSALALSRG